MNQPISKTMYKLVYWPDIPGRGEFVRLALEAAEAEYEDICNNAKSPNEVLKYITGKVDFGNNLAPLAPPILVNSDVILSQTSGILLYLGPRLGLTLDDDVGRIRVNQLQLTICDFVDEVHDGHHPIASQLYYEDQRAEAARRTDDLKKSRIPKFLNHFESCIKGPYVFDRLTYVDLSLFQIVEGLLFAFPKLLGRISDDYPKLMNLHGTIKELPQLQTYLTQRVKFGDGVFRYYPEFDV